MEKRKESRNLHIDSLFVIFGELYASKGGWVIPGIAIYDTMQFVQTICMGLVASMGSFILEGGKITKRLAFPHAWRQCIFFFKKKTMLSPYEY
ncbi:hypothetical protein Lal_00033873 [Lupinus albus]|nr:hypothetical protein Lal_00033873 [Lupinus albus]